MTLEQATFILALCGIAFHAGVLHNKVMQLRKDHDDEREKNRKMRHDDMDRVTNELHRLQLLILKLLPKEEWPGE